MSQWNPCKRNEFIKKLRKLGFIRPYSGTRHQFLIHKHYRLTISSNSEYSVPQLRMMIREVEGIIEREISADEWNAL